MAKASSRLRTWVGRIAGLIFLVAGVLYLFLGDTGVRQGFRLRAVREHLPSMNRHLAQSPKYAGVKAQLYTGQGGSMMLVGTVANEQDYRDLIPYAESLKAPVTLVVRVTLLDGNPLGP
ncbi:MAG TPA: hypothetical protein VFS19_04850 [Planctomycetota bacterium]|nr:hypothetical protein [Planctomycetota bacterium]